MTGANDAQRAYWDDVAPVWLATETGRERVSEHFGALGMRRLDLRPGERVLDIGCGSGATTRALAALVAPGGEAVGVDISHAMIAAATEQATAARTANARFAVCDVQTEDPGGAFDAAYSRFGVMFFADPAAAFANIRSMLRPGGRFAFVCWQELLANEWMFVPGAAAMAVTGITPPMPGPGEPGPFSLADASDIEALLAGAGFAHVDIQGCTDPVVMRADEMDATIELATSIGPVREALRDADADTRARVIDAIRDAVVARTSDGTATFAAAVHLVAARA